MNIKQNYKKIIGISLIINLIVISLSMVFVLSIPSGIFTISSGIYPLGSYTIWREGSDYSAKNIFGQIDYSGTNFTTVTNNAISALTLGGNIVFADGIYVNDGTIIISNNAITLEGSGWGTIFTTYLNTTNFISTTNKTDITIKNIRITSEVTKIAGNGILFNDVDRSLIHNMRIQNQYVALNFTNSTINFVEDSYFLNTEFAVIYIDGGNDQFLSRIVSDNSGVIYPHGIYIKESSAVWITDVDIIHSEHGILLNPATGEQVRNVFASNLAVDESNQNGAYFRTSEGGSIMRITFNNFWSASNGQYGFDIEDGTDIRINLAKIRGNTNDGFKMANGTNIWLTNSDIRDNSVDINITTGDFHWSNVKTDDGFSENSGSASLATGATVSHGLAGTPTTVRLTISVSEDVWVTALGASTFTVNFDGGGTQTVYWYAEYQP